MSCSLDGLSWNLSVAVHLLSLDACDVYDATQWKRCALGECVRGDHVSRCQQYMRHILLSKQSQCALTDNVLQVRFHVD